MITLPVANFLPHLVDMPLSLGEHLEELRRRLIIPVILVLALFIIGFVMQDTLKQVMIWPLQRALAIVGPEKAAALNLKLGTTHLLRPLAMSDSLMVSVDLSTAFAIVATIPVLLYQLWRFIAVGLKRRERQLGFLFIPAGVIFFYVGVVLGYFVGLPVFFAWFIEFLAGDPLASESGLTMTDYFDDFLAWTLCFGLIMDIPWAVAVLIRTGLVRAETFARKRKIVIMANVVAAAMITPGADPTMLALTFLPMQALFESGLILGRFITPKPAAVAADDPDAGAAP